MGKGGFAEQDRKRRDSSDHSPQKQQQFFGDIYKEIATK